MDTYPEITLTPPPVYHRHEWRLKMTNLTLPEVYWEEPAIIAYCLDCDATMTRGQVEAILNGENARLLTDEN